MCASARHNTSTSFQPYLITSSQDGSLTSQTQTYGTHNAGLAGSVGPHNHIEVRSRVDDREFIGSVKRVDTKADDVSFVTSLDIVNTNGKIRKCCAFFLLIGIGVCVVCIRI